MENAQILDPKISADTFKRTLEIAKLRLMCVIAVMQHGSIDQKNNFAKDGERVYNWVVAVKTPPESSDGVKTETS